jgi:hypothetical protein
MNDQLMLVVIELMKVYLASVLRMAMLSGMSHEQVLEMLEQERRVFYQNKPENLPEV